jgi:hypothetical protein
MNENVCIKLVTLGAYLALTRHPDLNSDPSNSALGALRVLGNPDDTLLPTTIMAPGGRSRRYDVHEPSDSPPPPPPSSHRNGKHHAVPPL